MTLGFRPRSLSMTMQRPQCVGSLRSRYHAAALLTTVSARRAASACAIFMALEKSRNRPRRRRAPFFHSGVEGRLVDAGKRGRSLHMRTGLNGQRDGRLDVGSELGWTAHTHNVATKLTTPFLRLRGML